MTQRLRGRPLRFALLVMLSWTGGRVAWLWPQTGSLPEAIRQATGLPDLAVPLARLNVRAESVAFRVASPTLLMVTRAVAVPGNADLATAPVPRPAFLTSPDHRSDALVLLATMAMTGFERSQPAAPAIGAAPQWIAPGSRRLALGQSQASLWVIARPSGPASLSNSGQLGGSQAGARATLPILGDRLALTGGVNAALGNTENEARVGVEWQPTRAPLRLIAEQRFGLDRRGGSGPGVAIIGGVGPLPVSGGFDLEAYGQSGAIARFGIEPYADGAVRLTRPVARLGNLPVTLGGGAWGGAQRGAQRLDIGPSLGAQLPIGDRRLRIAIDWRERVAGEARPGSGPALSIGTDF